MVRLSDKLFDMPDGQTIWFAPAGTPVTAGQLKSAIEKADPSLWKGRRVRIGNLSPVELAGALFFLDGLASHICLPSVGIDGEESAVAHHPDEVTMDGGGIDLSSTPPPFPPGTRDENPTCGDSRSGSSFETSWVLYTSGTTGTPKEILHSLRSLTRTATTAKLQKQFVWGSLYGLRRFAGLQVFLQAWLAGTPLLLASEPMNLDLTLESMLAVNCNALSATPSMWRRIVMHPSFSKLKFERITLGGEIVDQQILDLLRHQFPQARISHIYASTEAGVGFTVRDGLAGFPLDYLDAAGGRLEMKISEDNHLMLRTLDGLGDDVNQWLDSGDVVEVRSNRVHFIGRANGSINVGGNKVMPEEIEAILLELPEIAMAHVGGRKSSMMGNLVEAAVMPSAGVAFDAALKAKIVGHCRSRLEAFKVPVFIVEAKEFAVTDSGKIARVVVQ